MGSMTPEDLLHWAAAIAEVVLMLFFIVCLIACAICAWRNP